MSKCSVIVLSFDDGRVDLIQNVIPILEKYNLPATFNITTGYIDVSLMKRNKFCENAAISLEDLKSIKQKSLFEIAIHGDQHLNTEEDILQAIKKMQEWGIIGTEKFGFASPCHGLDLMSDENIESLRLKMGLEYIRIGTKQSRNIFAKILRRLALMIKKPALFRIVYRECLNPRGSRVFKCLPYNKRISLNKLEDLIKISCFSGETVVYLFHSILKKGEHFYDCIENMDYNEFEKFCIFLDRKRQEGAIIVQTNLNATLLERV